MKKVGLWQQESWGFFFLNKEFSLFNKKMCENIYFSKRQRDDNNMILSLGKAKCLIYRNFKEKQNYTLFFCSNFLAILIVHH